MPTEKKIEKAIVALNGPHTHAGVAYDKGGVIEVRGDQSARLIKTDVARLATAEEIKKFKAEQAND